MSFLDDIVERGLVYQSTKHAMVDPLVEKSPIYVGFDPTAPSLHVGSLVPLLTLDRYRRQGGNITVLLGGATGLIGDPSGKSSERSMATREHVVQNVGALYNQIHAFFSRTGGPVAHIPNNLNWYERMDVITFLRDVGKSFSVNALMARDSIRSRLEDREQGISYTEFSYALLQAYDFLYLYENTDCRTQMGASDQWGNIVSGIELISRRLNKTSHGITLPLLVNAMGQKYGKTESGTIWLDPKLTSPFAFYQFWRNMGDEETIRLLRWLTDYPVAEIIEWEKASSLEKRENQERLAEWLTRRVHGEKEAKLAHEASRVLYQNDTSLLTHATVHVLSTTVPVLFVERYSEQFLVQLLVSGKIASSKGDARRLIDQGGITINGEVINNHNYDLRHALENAPAAILGRGKAVRVLVIYDALT